MPGIKRKTSTVEMSEEEFNKIQEGAKVPNTPAQKLPLKVERVATAAQMDVVISKLDRIIDILTSDIPEVTEGEKPEPKKDDDEPEHIWEVKFIATNDSFNTPYIGIDGTMYVYAKDIFDAGNKALAKTADMKLSDSPFGSHVRLKSVRLIPEDDDDE